MKRNCVDMTFCKHVVAYRFVTRQGREEEAKECFRVFDKKERGMISFNDVKERLHEFISSNLSDDEIKEFMREIDPNNNG